MNYLFKSNGHTIANVKSEMDPRVVGVIEGDTMYSFYEGLVTVFATEMERI